MKVEIPREVAEELKSLRVLGNDNRNLVNLVFRYSQGNRERLSESYYNFYKWGDRNFDDLLDVLRNGYTVKQEPITVTITPEQIQLIKDRAKYYRNENSGTDLYKLQWVLNILEIDIEGVND